MHTDDIKTHRPPPVLPPPRPCHGPLGCVNHTTTRGCSAGVGKHTTAKGTRHQHSERRQAEDDPAVATDDNDNRGLDRPTPPRGIPRCKAVNVTDPNAIRAATGTAPPPKCYTAAVEYPRPGIPTMCSATRRGPAITTRAQQQPRRAQKRTVETPQRRTSPPRPAPRTTPRSYITPEIEHDDEAGLS